MQRNAQPSNSLIHMTVASPHCLRCIRGTALSSATTIPQKPYKGAYSTAKRAGIILSSTTGVVVVFLAVYRTHHRMSNWSWNIEMKLGGRNPREWIMWKSRRTGVLDRPAKFRIFEDGSPVRDSTRFIGRQCQVLISLPVLSNHSFPLADSKTGILREP